MHENSPLVRSILKKLFWSDVQLSTAEIVRRTGGSRATVRRALGRLLRRGVVRAEVLPALSSKGRPVESFALSEKGRDQFPHALTPLSQSLAESILKTGGGHELETEMRQKAAEVASLLKPELESLSPREKVVELARKLDGLAYDARATYTGKEGPGGLPVIEAFNCIHHALAPEYPEVCEFDRELLSRCMGLEVRQERCLMKGDGSCRFRFVGRG